MVLAYTLAGTAHRFSKVEIELFDTKSDALVYQCEMHYKGYATHWERKAIHGSSKKEPK